MESGCFFFMLEGSTGGGCHPRAHRPKEVWPVSRLMPEGGGGDDGGGDDGVGEGGSVDGGGADGAPVRGLMPEGGGGDGGGGDDGVGEGGSVDGGGAGGMERRPPAMGVSPESGGLTGGGDGPSEVLWAQGGRRGKGGGSAPLPTHALSLVDRAAVGPWWTYCFKNSAAPE